MFNEDRLLLICLILVGTLIVIDVVINLVNGFKERFGSARKHKLCMLRDINYCLYIFDPEKLVCVVPLIDDNQVISGSKLIFNDGTSFVYPSSSMEDILCVLLEPNL